MNKEERGSWPSSEEKRRNNYRANQDVKKSLRGSYSKSIGSNLMLSFCLFCFFFFFLNLKLIFGGQRGSSRSDWWHRSWRRMRDHRGIRRPIAGLKAGQVGFRVQASFDHGAGGTRRYGHTVNARMGSCVTDTLTARSLMKQRRSQFGFRWQNSRFWPDFSIRIYNIPPHSRRFIIGSCNGCHNGSNCCRLCYCRCHFNGWGYRHRGARIR